MANETLISEEYQTEQARMHRDMPDYGVECLNYVGLIARIIDANHIDTVLDYGSGKGRLVEPLAETVARDFSISLYDPGIPEIAAPPEPAQLVVCIDVLEHVEPQYTLSVLYDLARVTEQLCFITIGLTPASKTLSDGRNAHINLRPANDWMKLLLEHFNLLHAIDQGRSLVFIGKVRT